MRRLVLLFIFILTRHTPNLSQEGNSTVQKEMFWFLIKNLFLYTKRVAVLTPLLRGAGGVFLFFTNFPFKPKKSPCYSLTPIGAASFFSRPDRFLKPVRSRKKDIADSGTMFPDKPFVPVPK